jgi:hypothetical protein
VNLILFCTWDHFCLANGVFLAETGGEFPCCTFIEKMRNNYVQGIYKEDSHEAISSARLGLALCLQSNKRSLNSVFHLPNEIYTVVEDEIVAMNPDCPRCYHYGFHITGMRKLPFAILNHLHH